MPVTAVTVRARAISFPCAPPPRWLASGTRRFIIRQRPIVEIEDVDPFIAAAAQPDRRRPAP